MNVNIIGAGLAGCEAAYQLAKRGIVVNLFEMKRIKKSEIQKLDLFCELVCSNTLRSNSLLNAVGTLKNEMEIFDSLIINCAKQTSINSGQSLAVDREKFSNLVTLKLIENKNINIFDKEFDKINFNEITIIATGPLTSEKFKIEIMKLIGKKHLYFYDAIAPIIKKDSINFDIAYFKNRYDKGDTKDYVNCPFTKSQYLRFYENLISAKTSKLELNGEKTLKVFEGCMPIEIIAKRGIDTMRFGPLKPIGLNNNWTKNYAVAQLRQDNFIGDAFNLVGFQTNLIIPEQIRVFKMIPGLEKAQFIRFGEMHENSYINSPLLLNNYLQLKDNKNIFFAGQITGVEGYVESASSGIVAAINVARFIKNINLIKFPTDTVIGGLINYIINVESDNFQPMKANWSIIDKNLETEKIKKFLKREIYSQNALESIKKFKIENGE